jgi:hypothetical protein
LDPVTDIGLVGSIESIISLLGGDKIRSLPDYVADIIIGAKPDETGRRFYRGVFVPEVEKVSRSEILESVEVVIDLDPSFLKRIQEHFLEFKGGVSRPRHWKDAVVKDDT